MKYAIIGAGGTGGTLGFYLTEAGKDVTLIARGYHLEAMQKQGLTMRQLWDGKEETIPVKACRMEEYTEQPDVILVCVKGYSLTDLIPDIRRIAGPETVVLPILNIYGTGGRLQKEFPDLTVPDGCIYVSAAIEEPGVILRHGRILRVVFGARTPSEETESMRAIARDMLSENLEVILSPDIRRDAMVKFSYVSPIGTAGLYYNATAVDFQQEGEKREMIWELNLKKTLWNETSRFFQISHRNPQHPCREMLWPESSLRLMDLYMKSCAWAENMACRCRNMKKQLYSFRNRDYSYKKREKL